MSPAPIDYDALAKQAGATSSTPPPQAGQIDYDALAKQAGATSSTAPLPKGPSSPTLPKPQMQDESLLDVAKSSYKNLAQKEQQAEADVPAGFLKSAAQPAASLASGISKIPVLNKLLNIGSPSVSPQAGVQAFKQATTPTGVAQKVGAGAEQVGEMAATGGPLKEGAEVLAKNLPFLGKLAAPAARIGAEVINNTGNAVSHGQEAGPAALISGGTSVLGEALPFLAPYLKKSAVDQYSQVLSPTTKQNKYITQQVVPELLDRGQMAATRGGLQKVASAQVDDLGSQIDTAVQQVPSSVKPKVQDVINHLENYKKGFQVGNANVDPDAINKATELQGILKNLGPNVSYQDLNKVRQIWDKKVANAGGFAGKTLSEGSMLDAQKEGANAIRQELSSQSPDIAKINKEFHFWKGVSDVLDATDQRKTGQFGGLGKLVAPLAGFAGGAAHGGAGQGAEYAAAVVAVHQAINSTAYRTASSVLKNQLADALMTGKAAAVQSVASKILTAGAGQSQKGSSAQSARP